MKTTSRRTGRIVARDLMTTDVAASRRFYTELFGWTGGDQDLGELGIWCVLRADADWVARLVPFDAAYGLPSHWVGYVSVEDVVGACDLAPKVGGACCYPPFVDPSFGTFGMVEDPGQGFTKPLLSAAGDAPFDPAVGRFIWDQLLAKDAGRAARFYEGLYGWQLWGEGDARIFQQGGEGVASLGPALVGPTENVWVPHVRVESVDATLERARSLGAELLRGPVALPVVGTSAILRDPTGAKLGLLAPEPSRAKRAKKSAPKRVATPPRAESTPSGTPAELFARLGERFDAVAAKGVRGVVQYEIHGEGGGAWHVTFEDGTFECREGTHPSPTVTLALSAADYVQLAFGKLSGPQAMSSGRMKLTGDPALAMKLGKILRPLR